VFQCRALDRHEVTEPEFRFLPEHIEWRSYWLDVHMPGLRRWCFPEYEDEARETYSPKTPFRLLDPPAPQTGASASQPARAQARAAASEERGS